MQQSSFVSRGDIFDEMLGDIEYDPNDTICKYPFMVRVGVVKYRPPRHESFEWFRSMGSAHLEPLIYHKKVSMPKHLTFMFPERHLSVHEQQQFMSRILKHPQVDEIKQIDIITSCALMVSDYSKEMIRIITWPEDVGVVLSAE